MFSLNSVTIWTNSKSFVASFRPVTLLLVIALLFFNSILLNFFYFLISELASSFLSISISLRVNLHMTNKTDMRRYDFHKKIKSLCGGSAAACEAVWIKATVLVLDHSPLAATVPAHVYVQRHNPLILWPDYGLSTFYPRKASGQEF